MRISGYEPRVYEAEYRVITTSTQTPADTASELIYRLQPGPTSKIPAWAISARYGYNPGARKGHIVDLFV